MVWGVLRNPAYCGVICFGKVRISVRTRVMRPQRRRGTTTPSTTAGHQRPVRSGSIPCPRAALPEQDTIAPAYHRAKCRAGTGQLCELWFRPVENNQLSAFGQRLRRMWRLTLRRRNQRLIVARGTEQPGSSSDGFQPGSLSRHSSKAPCA